MAMNKITKGYPNWDVPYNENVEEYNNTIGNVNMGTTATTITGAIKEVKELAETETSKIQTVVADVNNNKTKIAEHTSQLNENMKDITNNTNNITNHSSSLVTSIDGVHGLKVEESGLNPNLYGSNGGEATISNKTAYYYRVGNLVHISIYLEISSKNTADGYVIIGGLPYKNKINSPLEITYGGITLNTESKALSAEIQNNTINIFNLNNTTNNRLNCDSLTSTSWFHINGSYIIDLN